MNSHQAIVTKVRQIVKAIHKNESTGHGYWHAYRVVNLSLKISKSEGGNFKVLELAGWLHDIAVKQGRKHHHTLGAQKTKQILTKLKTPKETIDAVVACVLKHRYSTRYQLKTIEEKIIQDADNLDALGAIIIPRIFAHCGRYQIPIYDPNIKPNSKTYLRTGHSTTGINHFYEKLFKLEKTLHTKTAKNIAKGRMKFLKTFLKQYLAEFKGLK